MIRGLLDKLATISRPGEGSVPGPEPSIEHAVVAEDVPCRKSALSAREQVGAVVAQKLTHRLFFDYGTDVQAQDRVTIDGVNHHVETVDPDPGSRGDHVEAVVREEP